MKVLERPALKIPVKSIASVLPEQINVLQCRVCSCTDWEYSSLVTIKLSMTQGSYYVPTLKDEGFRCTSCGTKANRITNEALRKLPTIIRQIDILKRNTEGNQ